MARRGTLNRSAIGLLASLLGACLSCPEDYETRTFVIDEARAAMVIDARGAPRYDECRIVCNALEAEATGAVDAGAFDGARPDAGPRGIPLVDVDPSSPVACELVSDGSALELQCTWRQVVMCYG